MEEEADSSSKRQQLEFPRKNVLLGCTGSVATVKIPQIVTELLIKNYNVRLIVTGRGKSMLLDGPSERYNQEQFQNLQKIEIFKDEDEWSTSYVVGMDPVLHIELRKWADIFVIAPLSANTLAKLANGLCDNLLTCVARAWDQSKPMIIAPAMNTMMWDHPFTSNHLETLKQFPYLKVVSPISKTLACKDTGVGAMAEVKTILDVIEIELEKIKPGDKESKPVASE